jgi:hypothetical protein
MGTFHKTEGSLSVRLVLSPVFELEKECGVMTEKQPLLLPPPTLHTLEEIRKPRTHSHPTMGTIGWALPLA